MYEALESNSRERSPDVDMLKDETKKTEQKQKKKIGRWGGVR
jgi:hypothetical protein